MKSHCLFATMISISRCKRERAVNRQLANLPSLSHFIDSDFTIFNFQKKCMYINTCASKRALSHFIDSGFTIFNFQKKWVYINTCASKRGFLDTTHGCHKTLETYQQVNRVYESQRAIWVLVYFSDCITLQINHTKF